jgi:6-phosphofructokinase 1
MLGTSRTDPCREPPGIDGIRASVRSLALDGLLVCGGDGTLAAAGRVHDAGVPIVGIPKTIDNDVPGTDYSFGFDTALTTIVRAVDSLHSTAESHDRVIVVEVMGRTTGWLAVSSASPGRGRGGGARRPRSSVGEVCDFIRHRIAGASSASSSAEGAKVKPLDPRWVGLELPHRLDPKGRVQFGGVRRGRAEIQTSRGGDADRDARVRPARRHADRVRPVAGSRMGVAAVDLRQRETNTGRMVSLQGGARSAPCRCRWFNRVRAW